MSKVGYLIATSFDLSDCYEYAYLYTVWGPLSGCVPTDDGASYKIFCESNTAGEASFYSSPNCTGAELRRGPIPFAIFSTSGDGCFQDSRGIYTKHECKVGDYSPDPSSFTRKIYTRDALCSGVPTTPYSSLMIAYPTDICRRNSTSRTASVYECSSEGATLWKYPLFSEECRKNNGAPIASTISNGCDQTADLEIESSIRNNFSGPVVSFCSSTTSPTPSTSQTPSRRSASPTFTPGSSPAINWSAASEPSLEAPVVIGFVLLGLCALLVLLFYLRGGFSAKSIEVDRTPNAPKLEISEWSSGQIR